MHTKINRTVKHSIHIEPRDLKSLWKLLSDNFETTSFRMTCSDSSTLTGKDLEELLDFENHSFRKITQVSIQGTSDRNQSASITVSNRYSLISSCDIDINHDNDAIALKIASEAENIILHTKPWFSFLTRISPPIVICLLPLLYFSTKYTIILFKHGTLPKESGTSSTAEIYAGIPILMLILTVVYLLNRVWTWIFPKVYFSIGRQAENYGRIKMARMLLFGSVILSIAVGLTTNFLYDIIKSR